MFARGRQGSFTESFSSFFIVFRAKRDSRVERLDKLSRQLRPASKHFVEELCLGSAKLPRRSSPSIHWFFDYVVYGQLPLPSIGHANLRYATCVRATIFAFYFVEKINPRVCCYSKRLICWTISRYLLGFCFIIICTYIVRDKLCIFLFHLYIRIFLYFICIFVYFYIISFHKFVRLCY